MSSTPGERCRALALTGARCRHSALPGSQFCSSHKRHPPDPDDIVAPPQKANGWAKERDAKRQVEIVKAQAEGNRPPGQGWRERQGTTTQVFARAIRAAKAEAPEVDDAIVRRMIMAAAREFGISVPRLIISDTHPPTELPLAAAPA
jgi:hypothetical protein